MTIVKAKKLPPLLAAVAAVHRVGERSHRRQAHRNGEQSAARGEPGALCIVSRLGWVAFFALCENRILRRGIERSERRRSRVLLADKSRQLGESTAQWREKHARLPAQVTVSERDDAKLTRAGRTGLTGKKSRSDGVKFARFSGREGSKRSVGGRRTSRASRGNSLLRDCFVGNCKHA